MPRVPQRKTIYWLTVIKDGLFIFSLSCTCLNHVYFCMACQMSFPDRLKEYLFTYLRNNTLFKPIEYLDTDTTQPGGVEYYATPTEEEEKDFMEDVARSLENVLFTRYPDMEDHDIQVQCRNGNQRFTYIFYQLSKRCDENNNTV